MTIRKADAEAAVKAIISAPSILFSNIRQNQHTMEKHFNKETAKAAAKDKPPQGYFKKIGATIISKPTDANSLSTKKQSALFKSLGTNKRGFRAVHEQMTDRFETISVMETSAASKDDILPIVSQVLGSCELYSTRDRPTTRFLAVAPMPRGFVGRSIEHDGTKHKDCDYAVVVVDAGAGSNPQIVTVYPATEAYARRTDPLV